MSATKLTLKVAYPFIISQFLACRNLFVFFFNVNFTNGLLYVFIIQSRKHYWGNFKNFTIMLPWSIGCIVCLQHIRNRLAPGGLDWIIHSWPWNVRLIQIWRTMVLKSLWQQLTGIMGYEINSKSIFEELCQPVC